MNLELNLNELLLLPETVLFVKLCQNAVSDAYKMHFYTEMGIEC